MKSTVQAVEYGEDSLVSKRSLRALWHLARPAQWTKNLFVFVGIIFSNQWNDSGLILRTIVAVMAFSLVSSSVYIMNDLIDLVRDRLHPIKRYRPLAAGLISLYSARLLLFTCLTLGLLLGSIVSPITVGLLAVYFIQNIVYSKVLKHVVILDAFSISFGFMLRIFVGTWGLGIEPSRWLLLSGLMVTLFLGFGKRLAESNKLSAQSFAHRPVLGNYSLGLLTQLIDITAGGVIISYSLYTLDASTDALHQTTALIYTVPLVIYGIFRYLFLIHKGESADPSRVLVSDPHIIITVCLWLLSVIWILN
ncbi:decaprenyl-phosphate phosphoribosyltransferase [Desulfosporosinus fructosivorans]|uniref:Decaprenyl-phosphate phosphoribosyltransferase n=1 Tax=Desulfosporosinus fructosivorans TaxID=2018669 RepID=A0A4Z0R7K6_9FIRM|nr:decaprenyl-phosphate phosphoribosyltransferase [Desulfosporosinus fructosivorans]TGE39171.1 decaprenyl-phosphate phosphoribosyltransferase [Desulfosporosinus fructosivorans]